MRAKWKIFIALNFILGIPAFVFFMIFLVDFFNNYSEMVRDNTDFTIVLLFVVGLSVMTFNCFLNIFIVQRYFPDKLIPQSVRNLNMVFFIINAILALVALVLGIYAATIEFGITDGRKDSDGKVILLIIFIGLIIHIITLVMQGQLPSLINRNNRERINTMINSIGE